VYTILVIAVLLLTTFFDTLSLGHFCRHRRYIDLGAVIFCLVGGVYLAETLMARASVYDRVSRPVLMPGGFPPSAIAWQWNGVRAWTLLHSCQAAHQLLLTTGSPSCRKALRWSVVALFTVIATILKTVTTVPLPLHLVCTWLILLLYILESMGLYRDAMHLVPVATHARVQTILYWWSGVGGILSLHAVWMALVATQQVPDWSVWFGDHCILPLMAVTVACVSHTDTMYMVWIQNFTQWPQSRLCGSAIVNLVADEGIDTWRHTHPPRTLFDPSPEAMGPHDEDAASIHDAAWDDPEDTPMELQTYHSPYGERTVTDTITSWTRAAVAAKLDPSVVDETVLLFSPVDDSGDLVTPDPRERSRHVTGTTMSREPAWSTMKTHQRIRHRRTSISLVCLARDAKLSSSTTTVPSSMGPLSALPYIATWQNAATFHPFILESILASGTDAATILLWLQETEWTDPQPHPDGRTDSVVPRVGEEIEVRLRQVLDNYSHLLPGDNAMDGTVELQDVFDSLPSATLRHVVVMSEKFLYSLLRGYGFIIHGTRESDGGSRDISGFTVVPTYDRQGVPQLGGSTGHVPRRGVRSRTRTNPDRGWDGDVVDTIFQQTISPVDGYDGHPEHSCSEGLSNAATPGVSRTVSLGAVMRYWKTKILVECMLRRNPYFQAVSPVSAWVCRLWQAILVDGCSVTNKPLMQLLQDAPENIWCVARQRLPDAIQDAGFSAMFRGLSLAMCTHLQRMPLRHGQGPWASVHSVAFHLHHIRRGDGRRWFSGAGQRQLLFATDDTNEKMVGPGSDVPFADMVVAWNTQRQTVQHFVELQVISKDRRTPSAILSAWLQELTKTAIFYEVLVQYDYHGWVPLWLLCEWCGYTAHDSLGTHPPPIISGRRATEIAAANVRLLERIGSVLQVQDGRELAERTSCMYQGRSIGDDSREDSTQDTTVHRKDITPQSGGPSAGKPCKLPEDSIGTHYLVSDETSPPETPLSWAIPTTHATRHGLPVDRRQTSYHARTRQGMATARPGTSSARWTNMVTGEQRRHHNLAPVRRSSVFDAIFNARCPGSPTSASPWSSDSSRKNGTRKDRPPGHGWAMHAQDSVDRTMLEIVVLMITGLQQPRDAAELTAYLCMEMQESSLGIDDIITARAGRCAFIPQAPSVEAMLFDNAPFGLEVLVESPEDMGGSQVRSRAWLDVVNDPRASQCRTTGPTAFSATQSHAPPHRAFPDHASGLNVLRSREASRHGPSIVPDLPSTADVDLYNLRVVDPAMTFVEIVRLALCEHCHGTFGVMRIIRACLEQTPWLDTVTTFLRLCTGLEYIMPLFPISALLAETSDARSPARSICLLSVIHAARERHRHLDDIDCIRADTELLMLFLCAFCIELEYGYSTTAVIGDYLTDDIFRRLWEVADQPRPDSECTDQKDLFALEEVLGRGQFATTASTVPPAIPAIDGRCGRWGTPRTMTSWPITGPVGGDDESVGNEATVQVPVTPGRSPPSMLHRQVTPRARQTWHSTRLVGSGDGRSTTSVMDTGRTTPSPMRRTRFSPP
jgi:hypothetical protein